MNTRIEAGTTVLAEQGAEMAPMSEAEWTLRQIAQLDPATTSTATAVLFARTTLDRLAHKRWALGIPGAVDEHGGNSDG